MGYAVTRHGSSLRLVVTNYGAGKSLDFDLDSEADVSYCSADIQLVFVFNFIRSPSD